MRVKSDLMLTDTSYLYHFDSVKALAKCWIPVVSPLEVLGDPLEVLRKAVEKPVGKVHVSHSRRWE